MPKVKLQSSDGVQEEVDIDVIQCSVTIKTMLEDLGFEEGDDEVIPLPNVNSTILKKVIQWATHHKVEDKSKNTFAKQLYEPVRKLRTH
jgi:S-phase kinase-associated protein 1